MRRWRFVPPGGMATNARKKLGDCGLAMTYGFRNGQLAGRAFAGLMLAFAAIGTFSAGVQAGPESGHHVKASLVAETRSVVAGQTLRLALRQQIEPGWHTYWSNPGESGLPTTIDWRLPQGFKAGRVELTNVAAPIRGTNIQRLVSQAMTIF